MKYAVVDTGVLIKGVRLESLGAERLVTIPEVLSEVRDKHARHMLATLPVELETKEPSDEAIGAIRAFAKLTGDLPSLSAVDTKVLALAWMLEKETKGGVSHLRTVPPAPGGTRSDGKKGADGAGTPSCCAPIAPEGRGSWSRGP